MFRDVFAIVISIHGIIHAVGFIKAWKLVEIDQFSQSVSKTQGLFWLLCALLFIIIFVVFLQNRRWWWMIAIPVIVLSQSLILANWQDAKFGTILNIIILISALVQYGIWNADRNIKSELDLFLPKLQKQSDRVSPEMIKGLPPSVQKWVKRTFIIGKPLIYTAHLKQRGTMKTAPDGNWMSVEAEQWFTIENPGFIWDAEVGANSLIRFHGKDKYQEGLGQMQIKFYSLIPVLNAKGDQINQGALVRYLAEMIWFPSAILSDYVTWEEIDTLSARATLSNEGLVVSGIFGFNAAGDVVSFEAQRYYHRSKGATLETWVVEIKQDSYVKFEGIRIPTEMSVTWKLKEGDFMWYRLEVTNTAYNEELS